MSRSRVELSLSPVTSIDVSQEVITGRDSTTINGLTEFTFSRAYSRTPFQLNDGAGEVTLNGFEGGRAIRIRRGACD